MHFDCVYLLLQAVVDYAGLFPPARLPLPRVIDNYAEYRRGSWQWVLGRLIIPFERLAEFENQAEVHLPRKSGELPWVLSCLLRPAEAEAFDREWLGDCFARIQAFNRRHVACDEGLARIETVEIPANTTDQIDQLVPYASRNLPVYIELPAGERAMDLIDYLGGIDPKNTRAKLRTGGIAANMIPSVESVVRFSAACVRAAVAFKATAGLHHPLRGQYALSYDHHAEQAVMHGFLNLLLAVGYLLNQLISEEEAIALMAEQDAAAIAATPDGWCWRGRTLGPEHLRRLRHEGLVSFGSCSFIEPIEDLLALGYDLTFKAASGTEARAPR